MFLSIILAVIVLDRLSKFAALNFLETSIPIIPNVFNLTFATNTGVAFGFFQDANAFFIIVNSIIVIGIVIYSIKVKPTNTIEAIARPLVIGGAVGNIIDRVIYGYVIDFLHFSLIDFPVFNIADSCICIGMVLYLAATLIMLKKQTSASSHADTLPEENES